MTGLLPGHGYIITITATNVKVMILYGDRISSNILKIENKLPNNKAQGNEVDDFIFILLLKQPSGLLQSRL